MVMWYYIRTCETLWTLSGGSLCLALRVHRYHASFFQFLKVVEDLNHDVAILLLRIVTMDPEQTARR
jgi:hypothetical protein